MEAASVCTHLVLQGVLKKLLLHHPVTSEAGEQSLDSILTQLYELENARGKHQPMEARVCPSKTICRFDLPMDFRQLESLSPQGYLCRFCRVCKRRSNLYRRVFEKFDKDSDGLLSLKEMERGICDLYMADVIAGQLQRLVVLIDADAKSHFDCVSFCPV
ncbi:uncharacterized protein ACWYII_014367 [Salvelinus alpinus]